MKNAKDWPLAKKMVFLRQIRNIKALVSQQGLDAPTLVGTLLAGWCDKAFPGLPPSPLPVSKALLRLQTIDNYVNALAKTPFLEAAYWLSSTYAVCTNDAHRKSLALFFTPPPLTERLLEGLASQGVRFDKGKFCDPACGGAAFLAAIAIRMKAQLAAHGLPAQRILEHVSHHLVGIDIDPSLCQLSKHFLLIALRDEVIASNMWVPSWNVRVGNSLMDLESSFGEFDVVMCNPPYRKMTKNEAAENERFFGEVIESQPNMYGLFMALTVKLLKPNGIAGLITPTSLFSGQYFRKVRSLLANKTDVLNIGFVNDKSGVFIDVEQETALTVIRAKKGLARPVIETSVSNIATDGSDTEIGKCFLPSSGKVWPIPRINLDAHLLRHISLRKFSCINDYGYRVRIGAFVWNRDKRPVFDTLASVHKAGTKTAVPLLWASDIRPNGVVDFSCASKSYRFVDLGDKSHRSIVTKPSILLQRVTSSGQPRRLVAAAVPNELLSQFGGYIGENHTVTLEVDSQTPALSPREMAELLSTRVIDRYFRCISGATNVSAYELSHLALPDPIQLKGLLNRGLPMEEAVSCAFLKPQTLTFNLITDKQYVAPKNIRRKSS